jgi:hypothetical protein
MLVKESEATFQRIILCCPCYTREVKFVPWDMDEGGIHTLWGRGPWSRRNKNILNFRIWDQIWNLAVSIFLTSTSRCRTSRATRTTVKCEDIFLVRFFLEIILSPPAKAVLSDCYLSSVVFRFCKSTEAQ